MNRVEKEYLNRRNAMEKWTDELYLTGAPLIKNDIKVHKDALNRVVQVFRNRYAKNNKIGTLAGGLQNIANSLIKKVFMRYQVQEARN